MEISSSIRSKQKIYSAKLIFAILDRYFDDGHYVYRVVQANGTERLIGSDVRPYPISTTQQKTTPSANTIEQVEVTIEYTSKEEIATLI